jgi:pimeloyl-ACP methyl ester carboxylesterase
MGAGALIAGPADDPLVVLIHGLGGSRHTWDRVLPLIEPHARVHALDLTGTGSIEQEAALAACCRTAHDSRAIAARHSTWTGLTG